MLKALHKDGTFIRVEQAVIDSEGNIHHRPVNDHYEGGINGERARKGLTHTVTFKGTGSVDLGLARVRVRVETGERREKIPHFDLIAFHHHGLLLNGTDGRHCGHVKEGGEGGISFLVT